MTYNSLLAHLAYHFKDQGENTATESLQYILKQYPVAAQTFTIFIRGMGVSLPENLRFDVQLHQDGGAVPDLTGVDAGGDTVLHLEAKFWAPLTKNQPLAYLKALPVAKPGMVLFVAPEVRFAELWTWLLKRCEKAGFPVNVTADGVSGFFAANLGGGKSLGLVSWRSLLERLHEALALHNVLDGVHDLRQLQGLCARFEAEGFQPFRDEDLLTAAGARIEDYRLLAQSVGAALKVKGHAMLDGYSISRKPTFHKRYMTLFGRVNACVEYNHGYWKQYHNSPLWLSFPAKDKNDAVEKQRAISEKYPGRVYEIRKTIILALEIPVGAVRDDIIASLVQQIEDLESVIRP